MAEADNSPQCSGEVNNVCSYIPAYVFMVWCLIKQGLGATTFTITRFDGINM
jgi:hypothetical protein